MKDIADYPGKTREQRLLNAIFDAVAEGRCLSLALIGTDLERGIAVHHLGDVNGENKPEFVFRPVSEEPVEVREHETQS